MLYVLKLIKGRSYHSGNIVATQAKPFVTTASEDTANKLVKTGFFELIDEQDGASAISGYEAAEDAGEDEEMELDALAGMTIAQLKEYAKDNGIDVTGCKTKAQYLAIISEARGGAAEMIDMQES